MKKIALAIALTVATVPAFAECYSDGIRVGVVQKISKKGYMMKSWEGELVMQGMDAQGRRISNVWKFSTLNAQAAAAIEQAAMSGREVALKYCQRNPVVPHPDIDTEYEIMQAVQR